IGQVHDQTASLASGLEYGRDRSEQPLLQLVFVLFGLFCFEPRSLGFGASEILIRLCSVGLGLRRIDSAPGLFEFTLRRGYRITVCGGLLSGAFGLSARAVGIV